MKVPLNSSRYSPADSARSREAMEQLLVSLEDYQPTIPDELVTYYLNKTGFNCPDERVKRLVAVAAQVGAGPGVGGYP